MRIRFLILTAVLVASFAGPAYSNDSDCSEALVRATYNRTDIENTDWRLASSVTENEYDTIKHDAGGNAVIYGVPVGVSYADYQNRVRERTSTYNESLTHNQAMNVMWTGLDPKSVNAYSDCLNARVFNQRGLHLGVKSATKTQVSILVVWTPTGTEPNPKPEWTWKGADSKSLPKVVFPGTSIVVLPRPRQQETLAINYQGYSDSLVVEPFPNPPTIAAIRYEETSEEYRSPEQVGWGSNWSNPYTLCTPDKPAQWTIVKVYDFHLESATERNNCGAWTTCGGSEADTPRRVCRTTSVQGHNENRFDGYGRMVSVFHVTWKHPATN